MLYEQLSVNELTVNNILGAGIGPFTRGKKFFLDPVNGLDGNDGRTPQTAKKTLAAAYALLTANQNDILFFLGGATANTLAEALDWDKSYTHLIGLCAPTQIGMRCRVNASTAMTPMFTVSGNGCIFKNIQFSNNYSNATTTAVCFKVTGARNYFDNCQFQGLGALGVVDNSHRAIVINSSDGENKFYQCTFGTDTVDGVTATNYVMEFNGAVQTARNQFEECVWLGNGSANSSFILATTVSALSSFQIFKRCMFLNNDNGTMDPMTQGFSLHVDNGGLFIFMDCLVYGAATLETTNTGKILVRNAPAAATGDIAIAATF